MRSLTRLRRYPPKMRFIGVVSASLLGAEDLTPLRLRQQSTILSSRCRRNSWASSCCSQLMCQCRS